MIRRVNIYMGPIKKLSVKDVHLNKDTVMPTFENEVINKKGLFTKLLNLYSNINHGTVLPTEEEAKDYVEELLRNRIPIIKEVLENENLSEEELNEFKQALSDKCSCPYVNPDEIKLHNTMSRANFKKLKKSYKK